jgi:two-component system phosphate regulon sensor histidine kinase PhoR
MSNSWGAERQRLLFVLVAAILLGWLTGYWLYSLLFSSIAYLIWHLLQLLQLVSWLRIGAKPGRAPDLSGAWELVVRYIYDIQKRHRQRKERLRNLLARFEDVAVALPDGAVVLRPDNAIDWSNKVADELLGIRYPEDIGQRIDNLIRNPEFHHYLQAEHYSEPLNIISPLNDQAELSIRVIPFGDGERLLMARDISSFMRMQAMRRDFVANVSHELRTPLTVMSGYLESLLDDNGIHGEYRQALQSIQQQSRRMQDIVEDLLHLSRLESNSYRQNDADVDVPQTLTILTDEISRLAAESGHTLTLELDTNLHLRASASEFGSIITNLLYNAIRHTPRGTHIKVHWYGDEQGNPVLRIDDDGPGISPEHVPRLTERFYRADAGRSRDKGGSGLGLAIVKHSMLRHGGMLDIHSAPGAGSSFVCRFPPERALYLTKKASRAQK